MFYIDGNHGIRAREGCVCVCSGRFEVSWSVNYMGESHTVRSSTRTKSNTVECRVAQRAGRYRRSGLQRSTSNPALLEHSISRCNT